LHPEIANCSAALSRNLPQANTLLVYAKVDPTTVELVEGFTRVVSKIGRCRSSGGGTPLSEFAERGAGRLSPAQ
jgi:hypothetical protein